MTFLALLGNQGLPTERAAELLVNARTETAEDDLCPLRRKFGIGVGGLPMAEAVRKRTF